MVAGKNNGSSSSAVQQSHQIFCCAFNANGTVFVTGSSDTLARVHFMHVCYELFLFFQDFVLLYLLFCNCASLGVQSHFCDHLQVWIAYKPNKDDSDQPNHEIDVLAGHENDVNYVQFRSVYHALLLRYFTNRILISIYVNALNCSGCSVSSRFSTADSLKEESVPKFRNSWWVFSSSLVYFTSYGSFPSLRIL